MLLGVLLVLDVTDKRAGDRCDRKQRGGGLLRRQIGVSGAAITKSHRLGGLKQQKFILTVYRPEVRGQGMDVPWRWN